MMKTYLALVLVFLLSVTAGPGRVKAQEASDSSAGRDADDPPDWLFPIAKLDQSLPSWIHIGGQYRSRLEAPSGIGYTGRSDFYMLQRLRLNVTIQPEPWLRFRGELQDARIFFNHHIPSGNPYEDTWTSGKGMFRSAISQKVGGMSWRGGRPGRQQNPQ